MLRSAISRRRFLGSTLATVAGSQLVVAAESKSIDVSRRDSGATLEAPLPSIRVERDRFIDDQGREVLLHGLCVISKSRDENYLSWHRAEDFARMASWGMNCVRLGIIWDGVEPEPGKYDDEYLGGVAQRIEWAAQHGIYVFLDMHQDLFSVRYSDGAPEWATLHQGREHAKGAVWSDSYLISSAVQASFDSFWANAPAPDGIGIQDHYAAAWRHVAKRFASHPAVIGYDLMNEPFEGSSVLDGQAALLRSEFAVELAKRLDKRPETVEQITAMWQSPDGRAAITRELDDIELYTMFVDAQSEHNKRFERTHLQPMYQRVANAIREVDSQHALLLETSYHCNSGIASGVEPVLERTGARDPHQAFVPHAYDIVVDTPQIAEGNHDRLDLILNRHRETAKRLQMPMIIGEWGAFGWAADMDVVSSAHAIQRTFEQLLCGDTYWDYGPKIDQQTYFRTLKRSIPCRIAGRLLNYRNDPDGWDFQCRWRETGKVDSPSIIYLTESTIANHEIRIEPLGTGHRITRATSTTRDAYVTIDPIGTAGDRTMTLA